MYTHNIRKACHANTRVTGDYNNINKILQCDPPINTLRILQQLLDMKGKPLMNLRDRSVVTENLLKDEGPSERFYPHKIINIIFSRNNNGNVIREAYKNSFYWK